MISLLDEIDEAAAHLAELMRQVPITDENRQFIAGWVASLDGLSQYAREYAQAFLADQPEQQLEF